MEFAIVAEMFQKMEETTKRIELTDILVELLKKTPKKLIPNIVYLIPVSYTHLTLPTNREV